MGSYFDQVLHDGRMAKRAIHWAKATGEAEANALRKQRTAILERAIAEAIFQHPEALKGLDSKVAAAHIASAFEG